MVITVNQVGAVAARITVWDKVVKTISLRFDRVSQVIDLLIEIAETLPRRIEASMRVADDDAAVLAEAASPRGFDGPCLFDLLINKNANLRSISASRATLAPPPVGDLIGA